MPLPYFKFMTDDWLGGLICTHEFETQGLFINLAARLWKSGGYITSDPDKLSRILRCDKQMLNNCLDLLKQDEIVCLTNDGFLYIKFILTQLEAAGKLSATRAAAGSKGGKARRFPQGSICLHPEPDTEPDLPPLPPKGGKKKVGGGRKKKRLTKEEKRRVRVQENTEDMVRIGSWFGRKPETPWSIYEAEALAQIDINEKDMALMEIYYQSDTDCLRRSVETLLNNWSGEMDRAIGYQGNGDGKGTAKQIITKFSVQRVDLPGSPLSVMGMSDQTEAQHRAIAEKLVAQHEADKPGSKWEVVS